MKSPRRLVASSLSVKERALGEYLLRGLRSVVVLKRSEPSIE
jgi:hypothetical protein